MTELNTMDKYETYAVCHHLSSWPDNCTFTELMEWLRNDGQEDDKEIWVWEIFEEIPRTELARMIELMVRSLRSTFP